MRKHCPALVRGSNAGPEGEAYKSKVEADLAAMIARLGEDSKCKTASDECEKGLGGVEGSLRFLIAALFDAHREGCVLAKQLAKEVCTANAREALVSESSVVDVYVHKWRGVYRIVRFSASPPGYAAITAPQPLLVGHFACAADVSTRGELHCSPNMPDKQRAAPL